MIPQMKGSAAEISLATGNGIIILWSLHRAGDPAGKLPGRDKMEENTIDSVREDAKYIPEGKSEDVILSEKGRKYLSQTGPWVRFLSILFFISIGFMVLGGLAILFVGMTGSLFGKTNPAYSVLPGGAFAAGLIYIVAAILYLAPAVFLSRYASAIKKMRGEPSSQVLEGAIKYQKSFWRYTGVIAAIFLVVLAAAMAFSFAVGIFMYLNR
jgi:hypothetical protein